MKKTALWGGFFGGGVFLPTSAVSKRCFRNTLQMNIL